MNPEHSSLIYLVCLSLPFLFLSNVLGSTGIKNSQPQLAKIAIEATAYEVGTDAVDKLIDQKLLGDVVLKAVNRSVRIAAVGKLTDQMFLAKIAAGHEDSFVRQAAVKKLIDQKLLKKIALVDEDSNVREVAVKKLIDQELLEKIAFEDESSGVRQAAVEKLIDQKLLAIIAVEDESPLVCEAAAATLTDQMLLAKIALENEDNDVRKIAIEKLADQAILANVARTDRDLENRYIAINKVFDANILSTFKSPQLGNIRRFAWLRLMLRNPTLVKHTDQLEAYISASERSQVYGPSPDGRFEERFTRTGENLDITVRRANSLTIIQKTYTTYFPNRIDEKAAEIFRLSRKMGGSSTPVAPIFKSEITPAFINVQEILGDILERYDVTDSDLIDIVTEAREAVFRRAIVRELTDQETLKSIALGDNDRWVRREATSKLADQNLLASIALKDNDCWVREAAVIKLTDQELMAKIAFEDEDSSVRKAAVDKLEDQNLLVNIVLEDKFCLVRRAAALRLNSKTRQTNEKLLSNIIEEDNLKYSYLLFDISISTDQEVLIKIAAATELEDRDFRDGAKRRLVELKEELDFPY